MMLALKTAFAADNRHEDRLDFVETCRVERWGRSYLAMTQNISSGGVCLDIQGMGSTALGADLTLFLRDFEPITATARWSHRRTFGLQFLTSVSYTHLTLPTTPYV